MIPLMKNAFLKETETKEALSEFIRKTSKLSMDVMCFEFEKKFAQYQGRKHAVLFNSGGSANLSLMQSLKNLGRIKTPERIGFSALTWSTNVMPIIQMGLEPVPVDCDPATLNVMSGTLNERLNEVSISMLFITNALGFCGDLDRIKKICDRNKIILIEDNCESLGTETAGRKTGNFGLASTFSFFVAHHMSTIEGGMVCTDDDELAQMLRIVRANGWDRNLTSGQQHQIRSKYKIFSEFQAKYAFYDLGFNLRPTEITGFLGIYQLQFLEDNINIREKNHLKLEKVAAQNDDLIRLNHQHIDKLSGFAFPVVCKNSKIRERYISQFAGGGVEIRPVIAGNIQKQPFYRKYVKKDYRLEGTDFIHHRAFYCGNYPELSDTDLEIISSCLKKYRD